MQKKKLKKSQSGRFFKKKNNFKKRGGGILLLELKQFIWGFQMHIFEFYTHPEHLKFDKKYHSADRLTLKVYCRNKFLYQYILYNV